MVNLMPGKRIPMAAKGSKMFVKFKGKKYEVVEPDKKFTINVLKRHVMAAKCMDPSNCVVARAVDEALPYGLFEVRVGAKITKIFTTCGKVFRYRTSDQLRDGLRNFDKTGKETGRPVWDLKEGPYDLLPCKGGDKLGGRPNRPENKTGKLKYKKGGRPSGFRGCALPTRVVEKLAFA